MFEILGKEQGKKKNKASLHHSNKSMVYSSLNVSSFNHPISKTEDTKQRLPNVKCQKIKKLFNLRKKQQADDNTCQIKRSMGKVSQGFLLFLPLKQLRGSAEY